MEDLVRKQKEYFRSGETRSYEFRKIHLETLRRLLTDNESILCEAVYSDFGKPYFEAYSTEIVTVRHEIDFHLKHLKSWVKPETVGNSLLTFPSRNYIRYQPFGTVLIIGAWNYPIHLIFQPLIGSLSAGNTAVLKPSEMAPATASLISELTGHYYSPEYITVVEGGAETNQQLLQQPFDKIFFTGSTRVGKIVMKAAAEQLIPLTLELGGKSPAIVHKDADIDLSAKRIWWGKCINAGQTCVAPDYAMVHEDIAEKFVVSTKKVLNDFYSGVPIFKEGYTRIINQNHYDRLISLLKGCDILHGGISDENKRMIEPTLVKGGREDEIMEDEIFGPILPLLTYSDSNDLISYVSSKPSPLALYLFTNSDELEEKVLQSIPFGGGCINDTISHLGNPNLPFGGVGSSGFGYYHGKHSFETFSHKQAILKKPAWPDPDFRYPPYTESKFKWIKRLLR
ncbi:MAG: aldehyde dehydrogenase family protein [Balneolaceae bacterium]